MEIREATCNDISAIVALLKISLGESLMPKSEKYWRWKHLENPFGASPVLLCWEDNTLIGVRAFMRWEWTQKGRVYRAVRAVDTATHPDFQGKGTFKRLTLALTDYCTKLGDDFVFNTPNQKSKPGYLKMGWEEAGTLPVRIGMKNPFKLLRNYLSGANSSGDFTEYSSHLSHYIQHRNFGKLIENSQTPLIKTNISARYLAWRYIDVPVAQYVAIGEELGTELNGFLICRIKKTRFGNEMRITDSFLKDGIVGKGLAAKLQQCKRIWSIDYVTYSGSDKKMFREIGGTFRAKLEVGPIVTIRSLNLTDLSSLKNFHQWSPSMGDLELF